MTKRNTLIRADVEEELDAEIEDAGGGPPFQVFAAPRIGQEYSIYLSNAVQAPAAYDALCHQLRTVTEHDKVKLYLNTPGGAVISGLALIQAMRESKATITTILNPQAFSMGALIFLCGDVCLAPPNSLLMFHNYSGGLSGKGNEQAAELSATNAWFDEAMHDTCHPFLTKKELQAVLQGKDLWMRSPEINKRLQQMKKATKK